MESDFLMAKYINTNRGVLFRNLGHNNEFDELENGTSIKRWIVLRK